jgi:hypothetical protein
MRSIIFALAIHVIWTATTFAGQYISPQFGFIVNVPSHWEILSAERVKDNPTLFELLEKIVSDKELRADLKRVIVSGKFEAWYYRDTSENVAVTWGPKNIPRSSGDAKEVVVMFSEKVKIKVHDYGFRKIGGLDAFYMEHDGWIYKTKALQYFIQKAPNAVVQFTLTCDEQKYKMVKEEFLAIIFSFKPKPA